MRNLFLSTGSTQYDPGLPPITSDSFGVRYVSYRNVFRFLDQTDDLNVGLIVWPGGALAETHTDRYGMEYDGLYNPATGKPTISEMMSIADSKGATLSVVLPTARYVGRDAALQSDVQKFMQDLLGGHYGNLPPKMILEIGNEYYGSFSSNSPNGAAADYSHVADIMIGEIARAMMDPAINTSGSKVEIAVQSGKTLADDADIRAGLSKFSLASADMIVQHRFPANLAQVDDRLGDVDKIITAWEQDAVAVGGQAPELYLSEWNVANLTRTDVLQDYLAQPESVSNGLTAADVDLSGRTTTEFEKYWQNALDKNAYGPEHPGLLLETFARYTELGATAAGVYGVDVMHPGRLSWVSTDYTEQKMVGGELLKMLYESVGDANLIDTGSSASVGDPIIPYAFENDDKLVLFLAAGGNGVGKYTIDFQGLGGVYGSVWAERLGAETPADWMQKFGIVDNPLVDEASEAKTYAAPIREAITPKISDDGITFKVTAPYEVIRMAFAKTAAGEQEIASWSHAPNEPLLGHSLLPLVDPTAVEDTDDDYDDGDFFDDGLAGMGALLLLLLAFA